MSVRLIHARVQCPHCNKQFNQIDGTEERALEVVRGALAKHLADEHGEVAS